MISPDGKSKSLDAKANGYCRSEAVAALFVQKRAFAKRIYASIMTIQTNCDGFKAEGITFPGYETQKKLLRKTIKESGIDVSKIRYIEAHITGTAAGDPVECQAIMDSYRVDCKEPLMFGCLKSNIGHTEGASATCAIIKAAMIFQNRLIPPNLHYESPNPNINGLKQGIILPVLKPVEFHDDIIPVNAFGFGGVNVHALLRANQKVATIESYDVLCGGIPRLVHYCGPSADSIKNTTEWLKVNRSKVTKGFLSLLNDVSKTEVDIGMKFRAYALLDKQGIKVINFKQVDQKRPIWFVFSPLGCQWKGMAKQLMVFEPFKNSILSSAQVADKLGINLMDTVMDSENSIVYEDIKHALLSIVAIQIALVDLLRFLGIKPSGIIGHSIGEVAAGYADGCISAEQSLLIAYNLAKYGSEAQRTLGSMVATDLTWDEALDLCPEGVWPACHNANKSVTIAGDASTLKVFTDQLLSKGRFAKAVLSCGLAYHCPHIESCFDPLKSALDKVIPCPKMRSMSWISTSVSPQRKANHQIEGSNCDGLYYANNAVSPVHFKEALESVPRDACVIEIGPHGGLLPLIKAELGKSIVPVSLMKRMTMQSEEDESITFALKSIGDIYTTGSHPQIEKLYPQVVYPVERETPSLSPLLKWDHSRSWFVTKYPDYFADFRSSKLQKIDIVESSMKFLTDHCVDGRNLFPATGYLYLAWRQLCFENDTNDETLVPVEFEDVHFERATIIPKVGSLTFNIEILSPTGQFVIKEGDTVCVTGTIRVLTNKREPVNVPESNGLSSSKLSAQDIYKELRIRGYDYGKNFQGLTEATPDGKLGKVQWTGHWISFTDSMLQLSILGEEQRLLQVPTHIEYFSCDAPTFYKHLKVNKIFDVTFDKETNIGLSTGLFIKGLDASPVPRRQDYQQPMLTSMTFTPYVEKVEMSIEEIKRLENHNQICCNLLRHLQDQSVDTQPPLAASEQDSLLTALSTAISQKQSVNDLVKSLTPEVRSAIIPSLATVNRLLEESLDLVIENLTSRSPKVVEIQSSAASLENKVCETFSSQLRLCDFSVYQVNCDNKLTELPGADLFVYRDPTMDLTTDLSSSNIWTPLLNTAYEKLALGGFMICILRGGLTQFEHQLLSSLDIPAPADRVFKFKSLIGDADFKLVSEKQTDFGINIFTVRKTKANLDHKVIRVKTGDYSFVENLKESLKSTAAEETVWLRASPSELTGLLGLTKCIRKEPGCEKVRCFISNSKDIPEEVLKLGLAINIDNDHSNNNTQWGRYTHVQLNDEALKVDTEHAYLNVKTRGDLSSFQWYECSHKLWEQMPESRRRSGDFLCSNFYSALNFKDVMVASGRIPGKAYPSKTNALSLGLEFSGVDENGNRVFGICDDAGLATTILVNRDGFVFSVPSEWTLEEATTVPVVYLTAYYSLFIRAQLLPNERVLIHAGSGGVGQAAIRLCLSAGCQVYTTVGTQEKKQFLLKTFPQLKEGHIFNSRTLDFEEGVMTVTGGQGVDVVLNCLSEEKMHASIRCLSKCGRFVEIGKYDIIKNSPLDPTFFQSGRTYHGACLAHLMHDAYQNKSVRALNLCDKLKKMLINGIKEGVVRPLPTTVFEANNVEKAFRFMASGKHIGKVLLQLRTESNGQLDSKPLRVKAVPNTRCFPFKSYVIVGGLGGMGLEVATWLAQRGAGNLVLTSRTGVKNNYQTYVLNRLQSRGVNVKVLVNSGSTKDAVKEILMCANLMGPVGGIFNLSLNLKDALIENQTEESFKETCTGKVDTTIYLDELSKCLCPRLDHFVCFSSAASGRGNPGQTNYGFANSVMENICEQRRKEGHPGLAVQWGAIGDVGFVIDNFGSNAIEIGGTVPQRMPSCLQTLDTFISAQYPVVGSIVLAANRSSAGSEKADLVKTVCHVLGINDTTNISDTTTLGDLGMDSLMAVEIRQALERDYGTALSPPEVGLLTIPKLKEIASRKTNHNNQNQNNGSSERQEEKSSLLNMLSPSEEVFIRLDSGNQGTPLFFIPPIEGDFSLLQPLVQHISRPIVGLNWVPQLKKYSTIEDVASFYVQKLRTSYPKMHEYSFVGYSFGVCIALEISLQLQKELGSDSVRNIVALDGSPEYLKFRTNDLIGRTESRDEAGAFSDMLSFVVSSFTPPTDKGGVNDIVERLSKIESEEEQTRVAAEYISITTGTKCDAKQLQEATEMVIHKLKLLHFYEPKSKFIGDVKLIGASDDNQVYLKHGLEDYGLSKIVTGSVEVIQKPGDHKSFLDLNHEDIGSLIEKQMFCIDA